MEERRQIYAVLFHILTKLDDIAGLAAWEDAMLAETLATPELIAGVATARGERAHKAGNLAEAEVHWRRVCEKFADTPSYGIAQFNLGYLLAQQKRYDVAITEYQKLFASRVNDQDPGSNIMEAYRNYRHRAAKEISRCYELQGKLVEALDWAVQARDKYRYQSWCGTCQEQHETALNARLVNLQRKVGEKQEALDMGKLLALADERDELWQYLQDSGVSALAASLPQSGEEAAAGMAAERLLAAKEVAMFLKKKFRGSPRDKAWAIVLLARLRAVTNPDAVLRQAQAIPDGDNPLTQRIAGECREDYLYAVWLAKSLGPRDLFPLCPKSPLSTAAHNVFSRLEHAGLAK